MYMQAIFLHHGFLLASQIGIAPITAGIILIAVKSVAYIAEIARGAVCCCPLIRGKWRPGHLIGLTRAQTMRHLIARWPSRG